MQAMCVIIALNTSVKYFTWNKLVLRHTEKPCISLPCVIIMSYSCFLFVFFFSRIVTPTIISGNEFYYLDQPYWSHRSHSNAKQF